MAKVCTNCRNEYDEELELCPNCSDESTDAVTEEIAVEDMEQELAEKLGLENEKESDADHEQVNLEDALAAAKQAGELKKSKEVVKDEEDIDDEEEEVVPKSKLPLILGITFVVLLLVAAGAIALIYMQTGAGAAYNKVVETYMKGYQEKDGNKLISCYPKEAQNMMLENATAEELWGSIDQAFSSSLGNDWSANYSIGTSKEISAEDFKKLKEDTESTYSASWNWGNKGYWVYAELELSGSQNEVTMPLIFGVAKLDGEWYVVYETVAQGQSNGSTADDGAANENNAAAQE